MRNGFERGFISDRRVPQTIHQSPSEHSCISKIESSKTATSGHRFASRLAAKCRLRCCRAQFGCTAGAPTTSSPADDTEASSRPAETDGSEPSNRPAPGLDHRLQAQPVGRQPVNKGPSTDESRQHPPSTHSEAQPAAQQQPPAENQPPSTPSQAPTQQPRAALQPLSAMPNLSQPAASGQVPVRHADFAGVQQQQNQQPTANVQFCLTYHAEFGQRLRVVGSHKNLGRLTDFVICAILTSKL